MFEYAPSNDWNWCAEETKAGDTTRRVWLEAHSVTSHPQVKVSTDTGFEFLN